MKLKFARNDSNRRRKSRKKYEGVLEGETETSTVCERGKKRRARGRKREEEGAEGMQWEKGETVKKVQQRKKEER